MSSPRRRVRLIVSGRTGRALEMTPESRGPISRFCSNAPWEVRLGDTRNRQKPRRRARTNWRIRPLNCAYLLKSLKISGEGDESAVVFPCFNSWSVDNRRTGNDKERGSLLRATETTWVVLVVFLEQARVGKSVTCRAATKSSPWPSSKSFSFCVKLRGSLL